MAQRLESPESYLAAVELKCQPETHPLRDKLETFGALVVTALTYGVLAYKSKKMIFDEN